MEKKTHIPDNYRDFWYLRSFDLMPKRLCDSNRNLTETECRHLYERGWIFITDRDAMRVRSAMLKGRLDAVIKAKGIDAVDIRFKFPKVDAEFARYVESRQSESPVTTERFADE